MTAAVERLSTYDELARRLAQQELVAAFGLFALRTPDLDQVLTQACEVAAHGLGAPFAKVLELRPASGDLLVRSGVGWKPGVVGQATLGADLASPAGYALRTKTPVISNQLAEERRFRVPAMLAEHGVSRAINVIVGDDGAAAPFGVLEVDGADRHQFTAQDVAFLQSLANVLAAVIDRQRQRAAQAQLLRDKDVLLQEVHHRTKNSLQLVQTLLNLQARSASGADEKERLGEAAARLMSIAAVHRRLHEEGAVERVSLPPYLGGLVADITGTLGGDGPARPLTLDVAPMQLPAEHVTPIGLIAVELVTNAIKYGAGAIALRVSPAPGGVAMAVEDEGAGFPPGGEAGRSSLGMRLIGALARTPDAITVSRADGRTRVSVRVAFPETARA